jgi:hypothetical protein
MSGLYITLREALESARLSEFALRRKRAASAQFDRTEFDADAATLIKAHPPKGRTSRSASGGSSSGKKTRRDTDQRSRLRRRRYRPFICHGGSITIVPNLPLGITTGAASTSSRSCSFA